MTKVLFRQELSTGEVVFVQKVGRKYIATKVPAGDVFEPPESSEPTSKNKAMDILLDWISMDVCETEY